MSRKVRDLTAEAWEQLPVDCRRCLFWELPDAPRGPRSARRRDVAEAKQLWYRSLELEWGPPGLTLSQGDRMLGFAVCMPADHAQRVRRMGSAPSDDALVLATMWIDPAAREAGLGTVLLHAVLRRAHDLGLRAVEAIGQRVDAGPCVLPEAFLVASGFVVHHEHPTYPLLRLDLRQTARWQDAMEHALAGVRRALTRPDRTPVPSSA